jgi:hypothetical protein
MSGSCDAPRPIHSAVAFRGQSRTLAQPSVTSKCDWGGPIIRVVFDCVVIGAGQAGLASYHLSRLGVAHVVLERGRVAETWRSARWDSFCLNTLNWCTRLPGM